MLAIIVVIGAIALSVPVARALARLLLADPIQAAYDREFESIVANWDE